MTVTSRLAGAILALVWMAHGAAPAAPKSWAAAVADSIIERNPGTPRDRLARWSYVTGYTLDGIEMVARSTGDARYWDFIKRVMDQFIDEQGHLKGVRLESLDNTMPGNIIVGLYERTHDLRKVQRLLSHANMQQSCWYLGACGIDLNPEDLETPCRPKPEQQKKTA